jgi:lipopolysaccharide/colanic/teichoic acid biosynthesis glycosyltransferase
VVTGVRIPRGWTPSYAVVKHAIDVVVACGLLLALSPLLLIIGVAAYLTMGGPVLFRQRRIGLHGREIAVWKFRTMLADRRSSSQGPPMSIEDRRRCHKTRSDPRVTPFGRFLRRTSLDELPQLWNIVRGDMSLVGPRPELPSIVANYEEWQHARHAVRPGLTGWWQVNRPADRLMHEVVDLDLYYVDNISFWLDMRILAKTVTAVIRGTGAF